MLNQITVDNVRLHGGTIAGGDLDVEIERDLFVEYFVNTSESWSRSHSVGFDLSTVGSLGMNGLPSFRTPFDVNNLRQLGTTLNVPPTVRAEHIESIHQTYSDAGIKTSKGFNVAGRTIELKPKLKNEDKIKVFDSSTINSIGENLRAVADLKQLYDSIKTRAINSNKSEKEAEIEAKEVVEEVSEIKEIGAKVEQKTEKAKQVFTEKVKRKIAEKSTVAAVEATNADDEKLLELANQYLKYEEVRDIIFDYETQLSGAYKGAEAQFASRTWSEKVSDFVTSLQEVYAEECERFKADPAKYIGDVAIDSAYFVGDTFIPGGLQNVAEYCHGRTTLGEVIQNESIDLSIDVGLYLCGAKIVKGAGKCLAKPICKLYEKATQKTITRAEKLAEQRKVGNVGTYGELTDGAPKGGFQDRKQAHHIPSRKFMEKYGVDKNDGLSIMMTDEQHALTRTFKGKAKNIPTDATAREELARDLKDVRKIMKSDGTYTKEVNKNLLDGVREFKDKFPKIFKKEKK